MRYFEILLLPVVGTIYFILSEITTVPAVDVVLGSIAAAQAILGTFILLRTARRYSGTLNVSKNDEKTLYSLDLNHNPEELEGKKEVRFKVSKNPK